MLLKIKFVIISKFFLRVLHETYFLIVLNCVNEKRKEKKSNQEKKNIIMKPIFPFTAWTLKVFLYL
jgi:hypothetical protein